MSTKATARLSLAQIEQAMSIETILAANDAFVVQTISGLIARRRLPQPQRRVKAAEAARKVLLKALRHAALVHPQQEQETK